MSQDLSTSPKEETPKAPKSVGKRWYVLFIIICFVGALAAYGFSISERASWPFLSQQNITLKETMESKEIGRLQRQVAGLKRHIATMSPERLTEEESKPAALQASTPPAVPMEKDERTEDALIEEQAATLPQTQQSLEAQEQAEMDEVARLREKVTSLEAEAEYYTQQIDGLEQHITQQSFLVAVMALEKDVLSHQAFDAALQLAQQRAPASEPYQLLLESLKPSAAHGLPRIETLQTSFDKALNAALPALHQQKTNPSFLERIMAKFPAVISIRKTHDGTQLGVADAGDLETQWMVAEYHVQQGNIAEALEALEKTPSDVTDHHFNMWQQQAYGYVATLAHLDALKKLAIESSLAPSKKESIL